MSSSLLLALSPCRTIDGGSLPAENSKDGWKSPDQAIDTSKIFGMHTIPSKKLLARDSSEAATTIPHMKQR